MSNMYVMISRQLDHSCSHNAHSGHWPGTLIIASIMIERYSLRDCLWPLPKTMKQKNHKNTARDRGSTIHKLLTLHTLLSLLAMLILLSQWCCMPTYITVRLERFKNEARLWELFVVGALDGTDHTPDCYGCQSTCSAKNTPQQANLWPPCQAKRTATLCIQYRRVSRLAIISWYQDLNIMYSWWCSRPHVFTVDWSKWTYKLKLCDLQNSCQSCVYWISRKALGSTY